ncbi:hypothetical protein KBZ19_00255 [Synechococcus sp. L2F]|uniref:hypothetical protein n=1 Tax=Synechococcus sp. L2F TaxID=2823739 RepID=UPI0020CE603B|nr:hypothetical protein [Synechococcus sp. L2F]MCP9826923.1 hypothetical protein [Synechococcus sp. L2F]
MKQFSHHILERQIGLSSGNSASKSLLSQGSTAPLSSNDKFVRETLQNSCDAQLPGSPQVLMVYRYCTIDVQHSQLIHSILGFNSEILPRIIDAIPGLEETTSIDRILYIEDYGTTGLEEHSESGNILDSKFGRFFYGVGDNDESSDSGGSFGYGKAVYTDKSKIRTIVAYSCYQDQEGNSHKLLFGVTRNKSFTFKGIKYPGFIFLCSKEVGLAYEMTPFCDNEADELASKLGFEVRTAEQTGTSVAIFGPRETGDCDLDEIKASAENYWWKKIIDGELTVSVSDDGFDEAYADPTSANHLKPFIDCYHIASGRRDPQEPMEKKKILKASSATGLSPGVFAYKQIDVSSADEWTNDCLYTNSVALIRASGMVVEYWKPPSSGSFLSPVAGVFFANKELNKLLRSSEPASHWGWDSKSDRIEEQEEYLYLPKPVTLEDARKEIESIVRRINTHFREFADACAPAKKVSNEDFRKIGKLLTEIFGRGLKRTTSTASRLCSIQYPGPAVGENPLGDPQMPYYEETVRVSLSPKVSDSERVLLV